MKNKITLAKRKQFEYMMILYLVIFLFKLSINKNIGEGITLSPNEKFYSNLLKDESDLYKIHVPKEGGIFEKIQIFLNTKNGDTLEPILEDKSLGEINKITSKENAFYEYISNKKYPNEYENFDLLFRIKSNQNTDYSIEYNIIGNENENYNNKDLTFGKTNEIKVDSFPFRINIPLPFKKENNQYNFENLLFNLYFKNGDINNANIFDELKINVAIINRNILNRINTDISDDDIFNNTLISKNFDLYSKSIALSLDKQSINNNWNSLKNKDESDELILYMVIFYKNLQEKKNVNLSAKLFLIYNNKTDYIIEENNYISDKLLTRNTNNYFNLYHLKLNGDNDKFIIDFSSNYPLSRGLYVSFLDDNTIQNIQKIESSELRINSTNVEFVDSENKKGTTYHFEFTLKNNIKDIYLCIISKVKMKKGADKNKILPSVNYIFKYYTSNSKKESNITKYELNSEVKYSNKDDKTIIELQNIKITNKNVNNNYKKGEIYIRKIKEDNKLDKESLDTIGIIESKNELVNGVITYDNEIKNIKIEVPKIDEEKEYYSILIDFPEEDEKFVYDTIHETIINKPILQLILSFTVAPLLLGVIIGIIIFAHRYKNADLKDKITKISFKEEDGPGDINVGGDEDEENNVLE